MEQSTSQKKYSFPIEQTLSNDYLKENFWKCLYTSCDKELHYWVILPNNVKATKVEPVPIDLLNMTNIGQYTRIDGSPYLEVQLAYQHSNYEMNASDWLKNKLAKMGEEIIEERLIQGKSTGSYLDCLCKKQMNDGETVLSRYTVLKDYDVQKAGANYVCIKVSCQEKDYEELALKIFQIVSNWDLSNKSDWQMAELLTPFMIDFVEPVKFFVPNSWEIKLDKNNDSKQSHFVFEHIIENKNKGIINAFFYELGLVESSEKILEKNIQRFSTVEDFHSELLPLNRISYDDFRNPNIVELFHTEGFIKMEKNFNAYLIVNIIRTYKGWYYIESVGSRPNFENFYWEINKRTVELIVNSFNNLDFKIKIPKGNSNSILNEDNTKPYKIYKGQNFNEKEWKEFEEKEYQSYLERTGRSKNTDQVVNKIGFSFVNDNEKQFPSEKASYFVMNSRQDKVPVYEFPSAMVAPFTFLLNGTAVDVLKYEKDGWCEILSKEKKKAYIQSTHVKKNE